MDNLQINENNADIEIKLNSNNNSNIKKEINNNNTEDTQFYLITLEDNNGEHQQIRIFKNSDPSEIAFNFCKENNLDFKSMKYIKKNIQKIIEQFDEPNHKLFFLDNSYSSIQEVDEENFGSENTIRSKNSFVVNESNKEKSKNIKEKNNINSVIIEDNIKENENEDEENINKEIKEQIENVNNEKKGKDLSDNNEEINKQKINSTTTINNDQNSKLINKSTDNKTNNLIISNNIKNEIKDEEIISNDIKNNNNNNKENTQSNNKEDTKINENKAIHNKINNNNTNINAINNKILKEKNISIEYQSKISINPEKSKKEEKIKKEKISEKMKEVQKIKKLNYNNTKVNKNNFVHIKKDFISNIINKNISNEKTISTNNSLCKKIKLKNVIPNLFKYMNPKQQIINEEYKTLIKKEPNTNRENRDNIIDKYIKYLDKSQKSSSKRKVKNIEKYFQEKENDKLRTRKKFLTLSNSNLNIKKVKEKIKSKNNKDKNNENDGIKYLNKNKVHSKRNTIESVKIIQKKNKSLSNNSTNNYLMAQETGIKKYKDKDKQKINKEKNNLNNNISHTSSNLFLKIKKSSNLNIAINNKQSMNSKIRRMLRNKKEMFDGVLSNTFIGNQSKINKNIVNLNIGNQKNDKFWIQNKNDKNKVIIKRNKRNEHENKDSKLFNDISKYNDFNLNNLNEKEVKTFEAESESKSKRITEMRNGLNKMFTNFLGQKNNILNTNYIINKRCRLINKKNKKNMSMNLSRYFLDYSHKKNKSPKYHLEINVSNNNIDNLNIKDNQANINHKMFYNNNNKILGNKINSNKKKYYILFNTQKQSNVTKHNTTINSSRILNSISSHSKTRKKIIISKKEKNNNQSNNSSLKKRKTTTSRYKDVNNNINVSNTLLINYDKNNNTNDYCLKILDQYYTINNTINITNNNSSLLSNFSNNNMNHKKLSKIDLLDKHNNYQYNKSNNNINNLLKNIFKCFNKDNNGFITLNYRFKIKDCLSKSYLGINREFLKVLEKMVKILYDLNRKNSSYDFDEDKAIIYEGVFIKYMIYIYNKKLNISEKKIFLNAKNDIDKIIKKEFVSYNYKSKPSFNKFKDNKNVLTTYNSSGKLNNQRKSKFLCDNIHKYFFYKVKKSTSKKKTKFNSFNNL